MKAPFWLRRGPLVTMLGLLFFSATYLAPLQLWDLRLLEWVENYLPTVDAPSPVVVINLRHKKKITTDLQLKRKLSVVLEKLGQVDPIATGILIDLSSPIIPEDLRRQLAASKASGTMDKSLLTLEQRIATAIKKQPSVALAARYLGGPATAERARTTLAIPKINTLATLPEYLRWLYMAPRSRAEEILLPASHIKKAAATIGLVNPTLPSSGHVPLMIQSQHGLLTTFATALAGHPFVDKFSYQEGKGLRFENTTIQVDYRWNFFPRHWDIPIYNYPDIIRKDGLPPRLKDKIVIVGALNPQAADREPLLVNAHAVASLRTAQYIHYPFWFFAAQRLMVVIVLLYLLLIPASMLNLRSLIGQSILGLLLIPGGWLYLRFNWLWLPVWLPVLTLIIGLGLTTLQEKFRSLLEVLFADALSARTELASVKIDQHKIDEAYELLMPYPYDRISTEALYQLACAFHGMKNLLKAQQVLLKIAKHEPRYKDCQERLQNIDKELKPLLTAHPYAANLFAAATLNLTTHKLTTLGRYQVQSELGRGAYGVVYLGKDPKIGRKVAIKTLNLAENYSDPNYNELIERFFREAEAAGRLDHPNIVTIFDVGEQNELAYIAMDYVEGQSLDLYTDLKQLLPIKTVATIVGQTANALAYAHAQNVVHRDIKPANIIYNKDKGIVKITDFGIACLTDTSKTRTGIIMGSPSYMSPEQVDGKKLNGRSDLFSLGITLYELLCGQLPFEGETVANLMYNIRHSKSPTIRKIRPGIPHPLARVISKALQKNPERRYKTGTTMAEALEKCYNPRRSIAS